MNYINLIFLFYKNIKLYIQKYKISNYIHKKYKMIS